MTERLLYYINSVYSYDYGRVNGENFCRKFPGQGINRLLRPEYSPQPGCNEIKF